MICDVIDINKFLTKSDFIILISMNLKWPWTSTHFIRADRCFGCGFLITNDETKPTHFIVTEENVKYMINFDFFWCPRCASFAVYDHYPEDECEYCN